MALILRYEVRGRADAHTVTLIPFVHYMGQKCFYFFHLGIPNTTLSVGGRVGSILPLLARAALILEDRQ